MDETVTTSIRIHKDLLKDIDREQVRREKQLGAPMSRNVVIAILLQEALASVKGKS